MEQIKEQLTDIKSMNMDELTEFIISLGEKKFRAKQIYEWIHVKHVDSFDEMTNISKKFIQNKFFFHFNKFVYFIFCLQIF